MCDHSWIFVEQRNVRVPGGYDIYQVWKCATCGAIREEFAGTLRF
jgi:hypothetical protein